MSVKLSASSLVPPGLVVDRVERRENVTVVTTHGAAPSCICPSCGQASRRVHSRYMRRVQDLPTGGHQVLLQLVARRFVCGAVGCRRKIFAERFGAGIVEAFARRTGRLETLVHHLGLALGGRPASVFARRLQMPVSNDTVLRTVRRRHADRREPAPVQVVGIDDWAFRKRHRYGTIVCDLARHQVVALLPDREIATVAAWLNAHPGIRIVARDRGGGYGEAAARARPGAVQVADRRHLMENASAAFLDAVRRSMRAIRNALGVTTIDPSLLTAAERLQYDGYLRREDAAAAIRALAADGVPIKEIVRRTGCSRQIIRRVVRGVPTDVFRVRESSLEAFLPALDAQWAAGCRNGAELWRRLRSRGFQGALRVVTEWATRRRRADQLTETALWKVPSARTIARLMTVARDHLTKAETLIVATIEAGVPALVEVHARLAEFHRMIRQRSSRDLDRWIATAASGLFAAFARGIQADIRAVRAAIELPWSNGQTEGQINRLKLVKRQMYGRAKLDLLEARLVGAT
jgi:transposase